MVCVCTFCGLCWLFIGELFDLGGVLWFWVVLLLFWCDVIGLVVIGFVVNSVVYCYWVIVYFNFCLVGSAGWLCDAALICLLGVLFGCSCLRVLIVLLLCYLSV